MPDSNLRTVPAAALRLRTAPFALAASTPDASNNRPFRQLARTGDPIDHYYWGRIVHDFSGMTHKPKIPIDYCHDDGDIIGFADAVEVADGNLYLSGQIVPFALHDRASEVIFKADAGIPYEASIDFWSDDLELEYIPDGMFVTVNERQFDGPGVVVRKWPLRGCAVCPHGYDGATETALSADSREVSVLISNAGTATMPPLGKKSAKLTTEPAAEPETKPTEPAVEPVEVTEPVTPVVESTPTTDATAQLRSYVAKFGAENGANWFAEGIDLPTALSRQCETLTAQLSAANTEIAELKTKLSQVDLGSPAPLSDGKESTDPRTSKFTRQLGSNLGKFAAGIRIPGRERE